LNYNPILFYTFAQNRCAKSKVSTWVVLANAKEWCG
jgi:hypothetical protein